MLARNLDQIRPFSAEIEKIDARGELIGWFHVSTGASYLQNTTQILFMSPTIYSNSPNTMSSKKSYTLDDLPSSVAGFSAGSASPKKSRRGKRGGNSATKSSTGKYRDGTARPTSREKALAQGTGQ